MVLYVFINKIYIGISFLEMMDSLFNTFSDSFRDVAFREKGGWSLHFLSFLYRKTNITAKIVPLPLQPQESRLRACHSIPKAINNAERIRMEHAFVACDNVNDQLSSLCQLV